MSTQPSRDALPLPSAVPLKFRDPPSKKEIVRDDLSAVAASGEGRVLWLASDETASVERLVWDPASRSYAHHRSFPLRAYFDLPEPEVQEMDIEGIAVDDGHLWIVGSHSLKRTKPDPKKDGPEKALRELTEVVDEANRFFLGRVPLAAGEDGVETLAREADGAGGTRGPAALKMSKRRNTLWRALRKDIHFGRFLDVPAKENGFDIEGLAVRGSRVLLGLRGPVLRGWAIVLEIELAQEFEGRLKLARVGGDRYRKHFLDLDGLGIRALWFEGGDLLILAGPTMDLDGPVRIYRWPTVAEELEASSLVPPGKVVRVLDLPFGQGCDHAEGATLLPPNDAVGAGLLVVYDSPGEQRRLDARTGVKADLFEWPR